MKSICRSIAIVSLLILFLPMMGLAQQCGEDLIASAGKQPVGGSVAAAPSGISDDFSAGGAPPTGWTNVRGTWTAASGYATPVTLSSGNGVLINNTQTATVNQWIEVKMSGLAGSPGVVLRANSQSASTIDCVFVFIDGSYIYIYKRIDGDASEWGADAALEYTFHAGDYVGVEITGVDTAMVVKVYDNGTSSKARGSWGTLVWTTAETNPGFTSGKYVGVDGQATSARLDDFKAGDI